MELAFEFWYLLPISILIATIAMSSGIGGAVFFFRPRGDIAIVVIVG